MLHQVQLEDFWLHSVEARKQYKPDETLEGAEPSLSFDGFVVESGSDNAECELHIDLTAVSHELEFGLNADVRIRARFTSAEPLDSQVWEEFASLQAVLLLWPYARELISALSVRMGLPPLLLPVLQIPIPAKTDDSKGQDE